MVASVSRGSVPDPSTICDGSSLLSFVGATVLDEDADDSTDGCVAVPLPELDGLKPPQPDSVAARSQALISNETILIFMPFNSFF